VATPCSAATGNGFTLLEVLVVLLIMGLLAGMATVLLLPDDRARLGVETERLAQLLVLASDQSRVSGLAIAWTAQPPGYRFWQRDPRAGWTEMTGNDLLRPRDFPAGMAISGLRVENSPATGPMRLEFGPHGAATAFTIGLSLGTERSTITGSPIGEIAVVRGAGARDALPSTP